jgi:hypothetical protein
MKNIPIYYTDIIIEKKYTELFYAHSFPVYNNINKSYLLSDIQFLTNISKELLLSECVVIYLGCYNLHHLKLLFKLFTLKVWILIDKKPFEYNTSKYKNVKLYNFILDKKNIEFIKNKYNNKNILYICNNNYTIYDTNIHLVNQIKIAIQFKPKYILLNSRFPKSQSDYDPYIYTDYDYYLYNFNNLQLDAYSSIFEDTTLIADNSEKLVYIKGEMLLPLYQHKNDNSFRLFIKQNTNYKYELEVYNLTKIYNIYHYYSQFLTFRFINYTNDVDILYPLTIPLNNDYFKLLIGYDGCIENMMEFVIYNHYLNYIQKKNNMILTFKLMSDINLKLKKYTKQNILDYKYNDTLFKYNYIWKKISETNKNISAYIQYNLIKENKSNLNKTLGSKRVSKNLSYITKYIKDNTDFYFQI